MAEKPPLLFLAHRIPYPPNKGDKIRSWHLLADLAQHFDVYLGTFVDDPDDWPYCAALRRVCAGCFFVPRLQGVHTALALRGLLAGEALSVTYYRSRAMQRWVDHTVAEHHIDRAVIFCSPMVQFVRPGSSTARAMRTRVIDFVDVDSEKWRQYASASTGVTRWVYRRESCRLASFEGAAARAATHSFLVSEQEATLFRDRVDVGEAFVGSFSNGVDTDYFSPAIPQSSPYPEGVRAVVFTGAMDYAPNEDAVAWFVERALPLITDARCQFWIVGGKPSARVRALASDERVVVTGRVPDVRPYLLHARVAIAPIRIARGLQNKVLEAMAMNTPVVASRYALEGLEAVRDAVVDGGEEPEPFARAVQQALEAKRSAPDSRASIIRHFSWANNLAPVRDVLQPEPPVDAAPRCASERSVAGEVGAARETV